MPRPLIRNEQKQETQSILSTAPRQETQKQQKQMDKMVTDRLLRKNRSKEYMEMIHKLDTGGHVHSAQMVQEVIDALNKEFPEVTIADILLGIVAPCYLGKPYEVHAVDIAGNIVTHYKAGEPMPGGLEKVRGMVMNGSYVMVEVYVDCCRAISPTGAVSVIPM